MKIASLYAAATEYVCALGLGEHLVAVSHECDHPAEVNALPRVTKTFVDAEADSAAIHQQVRELLAAEKSLYEIDLEKMRELGVDTILTQEQCGVCAVSPKDLGQLAEGLGREPKVLALNPGGFQDVLDDVLKVGGFLGVEEKAQVLLSDWCGRRDAVLKETRKQCALTRTVVLEWLAPPMTAGHWTAEMVAMAGGAHDMNLSGPAQITSWEAVAAFNPQVILIIPCGFTLERAMADAVKFFEPSPGWRQTGAVRGGRVYAVDGLNYFNRSGPRLVDSLELMAELIHPEKFAGWFKDKPRRQAARKITLGD